MSHRSGGRNAFTLIEILIVVVIIAILAGIIVPQLAGRTDQARIARARVDIQTLSTALDLFKADNGFYPSTDEGLKALVVRPPRAKNWPAAGYLRGEKEVPQDPWGTPYAYAFSGSEATGYEVICCGADGEPGGEDVDADITNRNPSRR